MDGSIVEFLESWVQSNTGESLFYIASLVVVFLLPRIIQGLLLMQRSRAKTMDTESVKDQVIIDMLYEHQKEVRSLSLKIAGLETDSIAKAEQFDKYRDLQNQKYAVLYSRYTALKNEKTAERRYILRLIQLVELMQKRLTTTIKLLIFFQRVVNLYREELGEKTPSSLRTEENLQISRLKDVDFNDLSVNGNLTKFLNKGRKLFDD